MARTREDKSGPFTQTVSTWDHFLNDWVVDRVTSHFYQIDQCVDENFGKLDISKTSEIPGDEIIVSRPGIPDVKYNNLVCPSVTLEIPFVDQRGDSLAAVNENYHATKLAAQTNVSRPFVSVAQFVGELKDLPSSVFKRGKQGISWARTESLGVRFGIMPMVSDILKMSDLSKAMYYKNKYLHRLAEKGRMRKKKKIGSGTITQYSPLGSFGTDAQIVLEVKAEKWGTIYWKINSELPIPDESTEENVKLIRGLVTGTSKYKDKVAYLADAWELLPWSWIGDWFTNFGEYLQATQNSTVSTADEIWIMLKTESTTRIESPFGSASKYNVSKVRRRGTITAQLIDAYVSADRAAILSGLAIRGPSPIPKKYL